MRWISHLYDFWSKSRCKSETAKTVKLQQQILSLSGLKNQSKEFGQAQPLENMWEILERTQPGPEKVLCV